MPRRVVNHGSSTALFPVGLTVRVSREISHHYNEAAAVSLKLSNPDDFDNAFWEHMDAAQTAIGKVAPLSYDMQLLGEFELAADFHEVRMVGEFVRPAFVQYHPVPC